VIEQAPPRLLQLKVQLRDVHPAVWRRFTLGDNLSIADLHRVIQLLMGWGSEHLHRFRIHGQDYGIEYMDGVPFDEDAEDVPVAERPSRAATRRGREVPVDPPGQSGARVALPKTGLYSALRRGKNRHQ